MTTLKTLFIKDPSEYKRDFDFLKAYITDIAYGISRVTNKPLDYCLEYVKRETGKGGSLEIRDPMVEYVGKNRFEDREIRVTSFLKYIDNIVKKALIVAPTFTVYKNKQQERAFTTFYLTENIANRSKNKKAAFAAKEEGDMGTFAFKWNQQNVDKVLNNGLSGAQCSTSTILYCPTIHSTLTSICRSAAGYGNSNNERIICGNRHYWSPDIVEANILAHARLCDTEKWEEVVKRYNLHIPTPDEAMSVVYYSSNFYYKDEERSKDIYRLLCGVEPIVRVMFCYSADFYHLAKFNRDIVYKILDELSTVEPKTIPEGSSVKEHLDQFTDDQKALISLLAGDAMKGSSLNNIGEKPKETQELVMGIVLSVKKTLINYSDILKLVFVPNIMPPTLAHLPAIVRRGAVLSDTDSTVFTVQEWLLWFWGAITFEDKPVRVGHAVAYLASAAITHVLATMSANIGVAKEELFLYAMKSEYYFPVFALTSRAKTYFALMGAQEGLVFEEPELEMKGAVMKGSALPEYLRKEAKDMVLRLLNMVAAGEKIRLKDQVDYVANIERGVIQDLKRGATHLFKSIDMKSADSYKKGPESSNFMHHMLWERVFAPKYGTAGEPPYVSIRITTSAGKPAELKKWLASIEDKELASRLAHFLASIGRKDLGSMLVPRHITEKQGLPIEISEVVDTRGVVSQLMEPFYVVLECIGVYMLEGNQQRLLTDYY